MTPFINPVREFSLFFAMHSHVVWYEILFPGESDGGRRRIQHFRHHDHGPRLLGNWILYE